MCLHAAAWTIMHWILIIFYIFLILKWYIILGYSKYEKEYKLLYLQRTALDKQ